MAHLGAQSNSKCTVYFWDKDRLSNLPDSLLCHILSFLSTDGAVVTSILSSRWKTLWTLVPKIDFQDTSIRGRSVSPLRILYSVLAQHTTPILSNFTLSWRSPCDSSHFDNWVDTAILRNVQTLDLHFECGQLFELPHTVFHCKTLVGLELYGEIELDLPPSFQLPSLKILRLCEICYTSDNSFSSLCSACPNLEDLTVIYEFIVGNVNIVSFKISLPFLKRLRIDFISFDTEPPDYKLEIYAPILERFRFFGYLSNMVFLEKLAHLIEAHFIVCGLGHVFEMCYSDKVFKIVRALNSSKFLELFPGDVECIGSGYIYPSMFQNLVRLNFKVTQSNWHVLQSLLVVAPNLEVLVLDKHYYRKNQLCWMEPPDGSGCLSSRLTTFNFNGFEELGHEAEFIKYILKEAIILNTITIKVSALHSKESVLKKLSMFPRHSTTCLLTVEIDDSLE
ncbi:F-box/LRR-repeat protein At3g26922-like [Quercus lobata]|uniref:F-box/LRR-repeat protein At3g26922-like n=1 Tax=Quercus lobata TaxID=97700 RepID=UPI001249089D|nr:F-box/LRR-repeat protein At3g26922-like [Quercus lobata]